MRAPGVSTPPRRVAVIGGGIIGLASAYRLLARHPGLDVVLLEKEDAVARHQSSHNSGVLHAGLYYSPGSSKARLAVSGLRQMTRFCREHGIAHETCGKVVVAADAGEAARLRELQRRGEANGLQGLRWMSPAEAREIEPHVRCHAALHVPEEGIADYPAVCRTLARLIEVSGGTVRTRAGVQGIAGRPGGWHIDTAGGVVEADVILNCAGLHSDRICAMAGEAPGMRIVPFRGEYYTIRPERAYLVRHLIYPVPDPAFPFLGVHFTRGVDGAVECGPNAVLALSREGYRWSDLRPADALDALTYRGLWRFLARYPRRSLGEVWLSLSRPRFLAALRRLVPELRADDLTPGGAGVRAQAMAPDGSLIQDFVFRESAGALHVLNAPSPGATAALAIADEVVGRIEPQLDLAPR